MYPVFGSLVLQIFQKGSPKLSIFLYGTYFPKEIHLNCQSLYLMTHTFPLEMGITLHLDMPSFEVFVQI